MRKRANKGCPQEEGAVPEAPPRGVQELPERLYLLSDLHLQEAVGREDSLKRPR